MGSGGGGLGGLCGQRVALQVSRVASFIYQPLEFTGFALRVGNAPGGRTCNSQANVFTLINALKHIGRFSGRRRTQPQPRRGHIPQESLFLVGRAFKARNPASGKRNPCHVEPLSSYIGQDVRADVRLFAEKSRISINTRTVN